jgi:lia operon protein LiaF
MQVKGEKSPVFSSFKSDRYSWILIVGLFLIVVQTAFEGWGFLFPLALFAALVYYGKKHWAGAWGKMLFWIGVVGVVFTLLSLIVFKLAVLVLFIYLLIEFIRNKRRPVRLRPMVGAPGTAGPEILKNKWFGYQHTPDEDYEWQDINIQTVAGDTLIDLSRTILPKGESIIFIRHFAGRVRVLVPYGIDVSLYYSVGLGQLEFFDRREPRLINATLICRTEGYRKAEQKVRILVSAVAGNLEVRRI